METLSERVRQRIRDEMTARHLSQRDIAGILQWSQSRIAKILKGRVQMTVDELDGFAFAFDLRPSELVRDRGLEFSAEMTPSELRTLERLRQLQRPVFEAVMTLLDLRLTPVLPTRHARPLKKDIIPPGRDKHT